MKPVNSKKMQLGVIKIAPLQQNASGAQAVAASNSSCGHICPTVCSLNCTTGLV